MIHLIEIKNYRIFKNISQRLEKFQILIGPNASGKTTFIDVISFVSDILNKGVDSALESRCSHFEELTWGGQGGNIEIALELTIPEEIKNALGENKDYDSVRYELQIGIDIESKSVGILGERVVLKNKSDLQTQQKKIFPEENANIVVYNKTIKSCKQIIKKEKNDTVYLENYEKSESGGWFPSFHVASSSEWFPSFHLKRKRSALETLPWLPIFPESVGTFSVWWLKEYLMEKVQVIVLNSLHIRQTSRPGQGNILKTDGSNFPWILDDLKKKYPQKFNNWIEHLQTALLDIKDIEIYQKEDDKHKYIKVVYKNGISIPSWMVSDGTLRMMVLTLIAYLPDFKGICLIEEPENGIHPQNIETVFQSLSSVYDAQVFLTSHSPILLAIAEIKDILCFAKTKNGTADVVYGTEHPKLKNWQNNTDLGTFFATGILG